MGGIRSRQGVPHPALIQSVDFLNYIRKSGGESYVPGRCWCLIDYSDICGEKQRGDTYPNRLYRAHTLDI